MLLAWSGQAEPSASPSIYLEQYRNFLSLKPPPDALPDLEEAVLAASNDRRHAEDARPLIMDEELRRIARFYARQIAAGAPMDHVDPEGRGPSERAGILDRRLIGGIGENLFATDITDPRDAERSGAFSVESLMNSPGHRRNILETRWTHAGIGAMRAPGRGYVVVQLFADIQARTAEDLPIRLPPGTPLPRSALKFTAIATAAPEHVGLVRLGREPDGTDLGPLASARTPGGAGLYRLYYAIPTARERNRVTYSVAPGPILEIR